jgi:hypothetical protein
VTLTVSDIDGERSFETTLDAAAGINRYFWPMRFDLPAGAAGRDAAAGGRGGFRGGPRGTPVGPGTYVVRLTVGDVTHTGTLSVRPDPEAVAIEVRD